MKYFEDDVYSNKYMAKVGGISTREVFLDNPFSWQYFLTQNWNCSQLSVLERLHLVMLKFSLMVTPIEYGNFCKEAVRLEGQVWHFIDLIWKKSINELINMFPFQILLDSVPTKGKKAASDLMHVAANLIQRLIPLPEGSAEAVVTQIIENSSLKPVKSEKEKSEKEPAETKEKEPQEKTVEVSEKPKEAEEVAEKEP
jgi:hypothetical protein